MTQQLAWKASTFLAVAAAAFFALHPVRASSIASGAPAVAGAEAEQAAKGSTSGGWFPTWLSPAPKTESPASQALAELQAARTPAAICHALHALGEVGDDEAVGAIAQALQGTTVTTVRSCAVRALGRARTPSARSWLGELLGDREAAIRAAAARALGERDADPEAQSILMAAAHSDLPDVRISALVALGNSHAKGAAPLVLEELKTADADMEERLIGALGDMGDPAAVPTLQQLVATGSATERTTAMSALGRIGGDAARGVLTSILAGGSHEDVQAATRALAEAGDDASRASLLEAARSPRRDVAQAALHAMTDLDGADVRDVMAQELASGDVQAQSAAVRYFTTHHDDGAISGLSGLAARGGRAANEAISALGSMGTDEATKALADLAAKPGGMQAAALSRLASMPGASDEARKLSLAVVGQGGALSSAAIDVLATDRSTEGREALARLARTTGNVASSAVAALGRRGDPDSLRILSELTRKGNDSTVRAEALGTLASSSGSTATPMLLDALHDADASVRRAALSSLASVGGPDAERAIEQAAAGSDRALRASSVRALSRLGTTEATRELEALASGTDASLARSALWSLARSAPDRAAEVARTDMGSSEADRRVAAVQIASQLDAETMHRVVFAGLKDGSSAVVEAAANALAEVGGQEAQKGLVEVITSGAAPEARRAAALALESMGGDAAARYADLIARGKALAVQESEQAAPDEPGEGEGAVDED